MANVDIAVGRSKYQINCSAGEEDKVKKLALKINEKVNKLSLQMRGVDDKTALLIISLMMQEEIEEKLQQPNLFDVSHNPKPLANDSSYLYQSTIDFINDITKQVDGITKAIIES